MREKRGNWYTPSKQSYPGEWKNIVAWQGHQA